MTRAAPLQSVKHDLSRTVKASSRRSQLSC